MVRRSSAKIESKRFREFGERRALARRFCQRCPPFKLLPSLFTSREICGSAVDTGWRSKNRWANARRSPLPLQLRGGV
jgi:hypothetical protein